MFTLEINGVGAGHARDRLLYDKTEDANFLPLSKRGIEGDLSIAYYAANPLEIPPSPPFCKGGDNTDR